METHGTPKSCLTKNIRKQPNLNQSKIYPDCESQRQFWELSHVDEYFNLSILKWLSLQKASVQLSLAPTVNNAKLGEWGEVDLTKCEQAMLSTELSEQLYQLFESHTKHRQVLNLGQINGCKAEEPMKAELWNGFLINHDKKEVVNLKRYHQLVHMEDYGRMVYSPLTLLFANRESFKQSEFPANKELGRWEMDQVSWISLEEAKATRKYLDPINNTEWLHVEMWLAATFRYAHIK